MHQKYCFLALPFAKQHQSRSSGSCFSKQCFIFSCPAFSVSQWPAFTDGHKTQKHIRRLSTAWGSHPFPFSPAIPNAVWPTLCTNIHFSLFYHIGSAKAICKTNILICIIQKIFCQDCGTVLPPQYAPFWYFRTFPNPQWCVQPLKYGCAHVHSDRDYQTQPLKSCFHLHREDKIP